MKLGEKAESADQPDVVLAGDSVGVYEWQEESVADAELVEADELTEPDQFPKYGQFVEVLQVKQSGATEAVHLEVPGALAKWLVEDGDLEQGERFRIQSTRKDGNRWEYVCYRMDNYPPE